MGECLLFLDSRLESDLFMLERLGFEITCLTIIMIIHNCQQELLRLISYNNKSRFKYSFLLAYFCNTQEKKKGNSLSFVCTIMQTVIWNLIKSIHQDAYVYTQVRSKNIRRKTLMHSRWSVTSLRGPVDRNFNTVSHKPTRAPIQFNLFPSALVYGIRH